MDGLLVKGMHIIRCFVIKAVLMDIGREQVGVIGRARTLWCRPSFFLIILRLVIILSIQVIKRQHLWPRVCCTSMGQEARDVVIFICKTLPRHHTHNNIIIIC